MSKELTEQWRNGTLSQGYYYIVANTEQKHKVVFYLPERNTEDESRINLKDQYVKEVLSPVPSYDEHMELVSNYAELVRKMHILKKKLSIATKALREAHTFPQTMSLKQWCEYRLKEIDLVGTSSKDEQ